jgi:hypothetical protein
LRLANASSRFKGGHGGMRPPHEWHREAEEYSSLATVARNASGALRDHSSTLQESFEMRAKNSQLNTQEALRSKLSKSENLAGLLSETLQMTDDELNALDQCKSDLQKNLARRTRALDLNMKRLQLRAQRPHREMVSDDVNSRLLNQGKALQSTIDKIHRCLKTAERDHERLAETREALAHDKEDKDNAISLDSTALGLKTGTAEGESDKLHKKVFSYPHNWYKGTGQGVQDARNLQNDSARLRAAIERMLLESKNAESQMDAALQDALRQRTELTNSVQTHLHMQMEATRKELVEAQKRKASLQKAIDDKRESRLTERCFY